MPSFIVLRFSSARITQFFSTLNLQFRFPVYYLKPSPVPFWAVIQPYPQLLTQVFLSLSFHSSSELLSFYSPEKLHILELRLFYASLRLHTIGGYNQCEAVVCSVRMVRYCLQLQ